MFTAQKVYDYCNSQLGVTKDVYSQQFNQPAVGAYCCAFGCAAFLNGGKNIGYWANCGRTADGGIQYGMEKAGFTKNNDANNLKFMDALILDRPTQSTPFDHFCFSLGTYRTNNGVREIQTIGGNPNRIIWFPVSQVIAAFTPNWDNPVKDGWILENGRYRHYTKGELDTNKAIAGEEQYTGNWYYVGNDGYVTKDKFLTKDGKWYYACKDGHLARNETIPLKADDKCVLSV